MIVLRNLTKTFSVHGTRTVVADNINATFPTGASVALLGRNGSGKSTLLQMIAGTTHPTSGEILSTGSVSFPVGLANSLHGDLTGAQNTRFVARIYGADTDALLAFVEDFAELGAHFHLPVRSYSSGMRGRLNFGINMGLKFDTYLVDEVTAVGDLTFKSKARDLFLSRMERAGAIFVSHSMGSVREMCSAGAVLEAGKLSYYPDVEDAIAHYTETLEPGRQVVAVALAGGPAEMNFPRDAQMLFGIGAPNTRIDWLGDCLRRHRPCHFPQTREPHYFDIRAGLGKAVLDRRTRTVQQIATRLRTETGEEQQNSVRLLGELTPLLAAHAAPQTGPRRHDAYVSYLLDRRKTQPVICDFTPAYALLDSDSFAEMGQFRSATFVFVLRDPATRLWYQIWDSLPARDRSAEACAERGRALCADPGRLADWPEADYGATMRRLEAVIDPSAIVYLFHETLTDRAALDPLCRLLGVPTVPQISLPPLPPDPGPPPPPDLRRDLRILLADQYAEAGRRFGAALPPAWNADG